jgi:hypothetical protein
MTIQLQKEMFKNGKYTVQFGMNKEAVFTIVDECFPGLGESVSVNRVNCLVREFDQSGTETKASLCSTVIGIGDGVVGVITEDAALRGKLMTQDTMSQCSVLLYE